MVPSLRRARHQGEEECRRLSLPVQLDWQLRADRSKDSANLLWSRILAAPALLEAGLWTLPPISPIPVVLQEAGFLKLSHPRLVRMLPLGRRLLERRMQMVNNLRFEPRRNSNPVALHIEVSFASTLDGFEFLRYVLRMRVDQNADWTRFYHRGAAIRASGSSAPSRL